jgi:DivIVA domain-containing protein
MLTPLDAEGVKFRNAFSGYDRNEVEQFRMRVIQALEEHIAQAESLRLRNAGLEEQLARYHESEELLNKSVVLAQRTADELIAAAHQRADSIVQAARLEGESIRRGLAELRSQREQFEYAFYGLLTGFIQRLEHSNPALAPALPATPAPGVPPLTETQSPIPQPAQPVFAPAPAAASSPAVAVFQPQQPTAAAVPAMQPPNMRDLDVTMLTAALDAARPEAAPVPAPAAMPPATSPALPLEEAFALDSQRGVQDAPDAEEHTELREEIT